LKKAIDRAASGEKTDFSADTAHVESQLEQILGPSAGGNGSLEERLNSQTASASASASGGSPDGTKMANLAMAQMMLTTLRTEQSNAMSEAGRAQIFSLFDAVKQQYQLPGRKTIVFFSDGLNVPQGTDQALKDLESIANRNNVSVYCIDARGLQIERQNKSSMDALNSAATESAKNQNTTAAVSKGQANSMNDAIDSIRMNTQENLASLAQSTGGVLIANTNDFRGPIRRIAEDIETYYELSYEPGNIDYDGSFHKITVKADQKDYKLQSRSGYFALPPSMTAGGEVVSAWEVPLLKAFDSTDMPKAFPFQASGLHYLNTEKQTVCTLVLDVPLSSITLNADPHSKLHKGGLSFLLLVKDPKGAVIKRMKNEIPLTVAPEKLDALKQSHFIYTEQFSVDPGRYLLEAAVSDKDGNRISARKVSMYVPPPASGIGLSSVAAIRSLKPKDDNTSATDPLLMANQVITPTLSPTVPSAQQQLPLYVVIYPDKASAEKPELIMQFSRDGQVIGNGRPAIGQPDAEGRIQYIADAPISKLGPGNYEVRFIAKQGAEAAQEFVTFTVAQ
jgi:VWFA-related protein